MSIQNIYIICGVDCKGVEFTGNKHTHSLIHVGYSALVQITYMQSCRHPKLSRLLFRQ